MAGKQLSEFLKKGLFQEVEMRRNYSRGAIWQSCRLGAFAR
jgi:hypothetical protein